MPLGVLPATDPLRLATLPSQVAKKFGGGKGGGKGAGGPRGGVQKKGGKGGKQNRPGKARRAAMKAGK